MGISGLPVMENILQRLAVIQYVKSFLEPSR